MLLAPYLKCPQTSCSCSFTWCDRQKSSWWLDIPAVTRSRCMSLRFWFSIFLRDLGDSGMPHLWVCGLFGGTNADTLLLWHILLITVLFSWCICAFNDNWNNHFGFILSLYMSYSNGAAYNFLYFKFSVIIWSYLK